MLGRPFGRAVVLRLALLSATRFRMR